MPFSMKASAQARSSLGSGWCKETRTRILPAPKKPQGTALWIVRSKLLPVEGRSAERSPQKGQQPEKANAGEWTAGATATEPANWLRYQTQYLLAQGACGRIQILVKHVGSMWLSQVDYFR